MKSLKISQGSHILSRYIYSSECRGIMSKRSQASVPEIGSGLQVWHLILPNILLWRYSVKLLLLGSERSPRNANVFPCVCLSVCLCGTLCSKALWWTRMTPWWLRMTPGWIRMNPNKEQRSTSKKNPKEPLLGAKALVVLVGSERSLRSADVMGLWVCMSVCGSPLCSTALLKSS